jgi:hypothetical protein
MGDCSVFSMKYGNAGFSEQSKMVMDNNFFSELTRSHEAFFPSFFSFSPGNPAFFP